MYQLVTISPWKDEAVLQFAELIVSLLCIINLVESINHRPHISPSYIRPMRTSHTILYACTPPVPHLGSPRSNHRMVQIHFYRQNCSHRSPRSPRALNSGPRKAESKVQLPQMRGKLPRSIHVLAASAVSSWPGTEFQRPTITKPQVREVGVTEG
jgi:hypothetical protein